MKINRIINGIYTVIFRFIFKIKGVKLGKGVIFKRKPLLIKHKKSFIQIDDNVLINSDNYGYHINMFKECKIMADEEKAIIKIGKNSRIHGTCIHAKKRIIIGKNCLIAANTNIIDSNGHELSMDKPYNRINTYDKGETIIIEDNVWIGANCVILKGVKIGQGSVITANSVVIKNIPANSLAGGNPAKVIKNYNYANKSKK